jgi:RNA 3'-terminal phosphate cyclase
MAGDSPGYSLSLVAETTTGVLLSVERTAASRVGGSAAGPGQAPAQGWTGGAAAGAGSSAGGAADLPEDVGRECAMMLLQEVYKGKGGFAPVSCTLRGY